MEYQSAARAAEHGLEPGAVCDRAGAAEPPQPAPVWNSPAGKLSDLHPAQPDSAISDLGLSGRRKVLGSQCMQVLMQERCQLRPRPRACPTPSLVATGSWPLMAQCSTRLIPQRTRPPLGAAATNMEPGAYPQVKCVLLAECGSHAVVGLEMDRYDVSEVHGAYRLLCKSAPTR